MRVLRQVRADGKSKVFCIFDCPKLCSMDVIVIGKKVPVVGNP